MIMCKKPVTRITDATIFERGQMRNVVATIYPGGTLGFRLKGTRTEYFMPVAKVFMNAIKLQALENARQKKKIKRSII